MTGIRIRPEDENGDGLVQGAFQGMEGQLECTFWFAYEAADTPHLPTVSHEVLHWLAIYHEGTGGHPLELELNGRTWPADDVMITGGCWRRGCGARGSVGRRSGGIGWMGSVTG